MLNLRIIDPPVQPVQNIICTRLTPVRTGGIPNLPPLLPANHNNENEQVRQQKRQGTTARPGAVTKTRLIES